MAIKQRTLKQTMDQNKITKDIRRLLEINENENTAH